MAKSKVPEYTISLTLGGQTIKSSGSSVEEALVALNAPRKIVTKGSIKVEFGEKKAELFFPPIKIKRLMYPISRALTAKKLALLLK